MNLATAQLNSSMPLSVALNFIVFLNTCGFIWCKRDSARRLFRGLEPVPIVLTTRRRGRHNPLIIWRRCFDLVLTTTCQKRASTSASSR